MINSRNRKLNEDNHRCFAQWTINESETIETSEKGDRTINTFWNNLCIIVHSIDRYLNTIHLWAILHLNFFLYWGSQPVVAVSGHLHWVDSSKRNAHESELAWNWPFKIWSKMDEVEEEKMNILFSCVKSTIFFHATLTNWRAKKKPNWPILHYDHHL